MGEIFLGREAMGEGLARHELRRWYRPLFRGVYVPKVYTPTLHDRAVGAWLTTVAGLPATTPARTAFDLGRYQKRSMAIGRLDALMRAAPFGDDEVMSLMRRYGPVRGVRQLRTLLPLVDPGSEALRESW